MQSHSMFALARPWLNRLHACRELSATTAKASTRIDRKVKEAFWILQNGQGLFKEFQNDHGKPHSFMTPLQHSLQAANSALKSGAESDLVLAALFHDCGHFVRHAVGDPLPGTEYTDLLGYAWLDHLGVSKHVCAVVSASKQARRYLCYADKEYHHNLFQQAIGKEQVQDVAMKPDEAASFERSTIFESAMSLRRWCDDEMRAEKKVPGLRNYKELLEDHLGDQLTHEIFWEDLGEHGTYHVKR